LSSKAAYQAKKQGVGFRGQVESIDSATGGSSIFMILVEIAGSSAAGGFLAMTFFLLEGFSLWIHPSADKSAYLASLE